MDFGFVDFEDVLEMNQNTHTGVNQLPQMSDDDWIDCVLGLKNVEEICTPVKNQMFMEIEQNSHESVSTGPISTEDSLGDRAEEIDNLSQNEEKSVSRNHNFQKHTVTALRTILTEDILRMECEEEAILPALEQLWRCFLAIKGKRIMTKKFLFTLFCGNKASLKDFQSYGF